MKRIVCFAAALLLMACMTVSACAAPQTPVINSQMPDCYANMGGDSIQLFTDVASPAEGWLEIQWYSTTVNDISTIMAILDANGSSYTVPQELGVRYYCYGVWNVTADGQRSQPQYSRLIRTEYYNAVTTLELISPPTKLSYTLGEAFDPTGMGVRVYLPDGSQFDSWHGQGLDYPEFAFINPGQQVVEVFYGSSFIQIKVSVEEQAHSHAYGEWMTLTEASCTQPGMMLRECNCGNEDRSDIPALGHSWDAGKISVEPAPGKEGERVYTCSRCGETEKRPIEALPVPEAAPAVTASPSQTQAPQSPEDSPAPPAASDEDGGGSKGLVIAIAVMLSIIAVSLGGIFYMLIKRKR